MTRPFIAALLALSSLVAELPAAELKQRSAVERLEPARLEAVQQARQAFAAARKPQPGPGIYQDYKAVLHVHAEDSDHTGGTRAEVLAAALKTGVRIVMFTDHRGPKPETWRGLRDGVLFIPGSEEKDRLRFPALNPATGQLEEDLDFICHVEDRYDLSSEGFIGMEIYNRHTDMKDDLEFLGWFGNVLGDDRRWAEFLKLYAQYPDETFAASTGSWPKILAKWDAETAKRRFTGIGANDAHQNQVYKGLMLDPYEVSFRNLSTHVLARELTEPAVRDALREGHAYVSHDWLCDPEGFQFVAANNLGVFTMGDPATLMGETKLVAQTPVPAKIKLFHNGKLRAEQTGDRVMFDTRDTGTYRVEAWLEVDGEDRPWIYSNPIYLQHPNILDIPLPSLEVPRHVAITRDITYRTGDPSVAEKHKLDLYLPRNTKNFPVMIFLHGGAWRSGDRKQYLPLGNRYATEGIGVVIPSYRLAPQHPHPAQINDAAAAFAWVHRHIAEHGGDTNRIFLAGHSAGGHLASLLALDPSHLREHHLPHSAIRGVASLSGVYDLELDSQEKVFGRDPAVRKSASPLNHITETAPPFLITYCEWDYFPLARQAQQFHQALTAAKVPAQIVFIPKQNHISEMLAVSQKDDLTARSVASFILEQKQDSGPAEKR